MNIFKSVRVWVYIILLLSSILIIAPQMYTEGVAIRAVLEKSPASLAGIEAARQGTRPVDLEHVLMIDSSPVTSLTQYYHLVQNLSINQTLTLKTDSQTYFIDMQNQTDIGIRASKPATSNVRLGLDLQGGTRIILKPEQNISLEDFSLLQDNIERRLNVFGLTDMRVQLVSDTSGKPAYLLVEIAGVSVDEIKSLISRQGKFEARVANNTVIVGDQVTVVTGQRVQFAGVDTNTCRSDASGSACQFTFPIRIDAKAAQAFANATRNLTITTEGTQRYLSEPIELYLDDQLVDSLSIAADLKGKAVNDISISGTGVGSSTQDAIRQASKNMRELQTILKTGNLPTKLTIVRADTISSSIGATFIANAILVGLVAMVLVFAIVLLRYRSLKIALPMSFISFSEVLMLLGAITFFNGTIDLAGIAGIIVMIGSGINHQIIITDEILIGKKTKENWSTRLKKAFGVIFIAGCTTVVAMLPLYFAGATLLKGFATVTIVGLVIGVLVARPAYGVIARALLEHTESKTAAKE